jgi:hypothetical protein
VQEISAGNVTGRFGSTAVGRRGNRSRSTATRKARACGSWISSPPLGYHPFRATGITVYLLNGGLLEYAQQHESERTRKLYDRRNDQVTLDQVERIVL